MGVSVSLVVAIHSLSEKNTTIKVDIGDNWTHFLYAFSDFP